MTIRKLKAYVYKKGKKNTFCFLPDYEEGGRPSWRGHSWRLKGEGPANSWTNLGRTRLINI
jgi:hypothetical protein